VELLDRYRQEQARACREDGISLYDISVGPGGASAAPSKKVTFTYLVKQCTPRNQ